MSLKQPLPYVVAIILGLVTYFGPGGCVREPESLAEQAETAASEAESLSGLPPKMPETEAEQIITDYRESLIQWQENPLSSRWMLGTVIPAPPENTILRSMNYGPSSPTQSYTHARDVFVEFLTPDTEPAENLEFVEETEEDTEALDAPVANPERLRELQDWALAWNARHDVQLYSYEASEQGTLKVSAKIWFRDARIDCTEEKAVPFDCTEPEPGLEETESDAETETET